jgi:hypothetical protein
MTSARARQMRLQPGPPLRPGDFAAASITALARAFLRGRSNIDSAAGYSPSKSGLDCLARPAARRCCQLSVGLNWCGRRILAV